QNAAMPDLDVADMQVEPFRVDTEGTSQFDMVWYFKETDTGLTAWLRYRTELSGLATVMAENMQTLLQGIVTDPDQRLMDLPCLSEEERQGLPVFINQDQAVPETGRPGPESYIAPRNPQEQQLALIWETVLKTAPVGIHDNFFDLGGTSVAALSLLNRVQQHFGSNLSLAMLFQARTVAEQAEVVREKGRSSALVPLQPKGSKPPFFYVPPGGSTALGGAKYAQYLGTDQPFYGLQPLGFEEGETPHDRVEDMAAYYIRAIREFQPEGPYYLGGPCFGVHVAFKMAQQLHRQGCTVGFLALFDFVVPGPSSRSQTKGLEKVSYSARRAVYEFKYGNLPKKLYQLFILPHRQRLKKKRAYRPAGPQERRVQLVQESHRAAMKKDHPEVYHGKITLFQNSEYYDREKKNFYVKNWKDLTTGGFERHVIQGSHREILGGGPQFQELLKKFKTCLDKAQQDNAAAHTS
ncbi:MAG: hypothetical protein D3915_15025, partial [Candidatus Electrothrix sp. AU1_5]|nr:hypothetical protein [Candidatus Electrothrix gigas]